MCVCQATTKSAFGSLLQLLQSCKWSSHFALLRLGLPCRFGAGRPSSLLTRAPSLCNCIPGVQKLKHAHQTVSAKPACREQVYTEEVTLLHKLLVGSNFHRTGICSLHCSLHCMLQSGWPHKFAPGRAMCKASLMVGPKSTVGISGGNGSWQGSSGTACSGREASSHTCSYFLNIKMLMLLQSPLLMRKPFALQLAGILVMNACIHAVRCVSQQTLLCIVPARH